MKKMRLAMMLVALATISAESFAAMSMNEIRHEARFLTDRMGHELGLSNRQYNDVYEINFDFLYQVNEVIDDVVYGYDDAVDYYYYLLDVRNEDLMYVLRDGQYRKFVNRDYFYRPIYMVGNTWEMRVWDRCTDRNYFYFSIPTCCHTYSGAHYRIHFAHSYYAGLYTHKLFEGAFRLWGGGYDHRHHDGWKSIGKKKHPVTSSRPWSNAKNYEKSRRDLKAGFVNIPSRDANKRTVKVDSEENRRTAVTSNTPTRTGSSRSDATKSSTSSRTSSAAASSGRSSATTATRRDNTSSAGTSNRSTATVRSSSNNNSSSKSNAGSSTRRTSATGTTVKSDNKSTGSVSSSRTSGTSSSSRSSSASVSSSRISNRGSSNKSCVSGSASRSNSSSKSNVSSSRNSSSSRSSVSNSSSNSSRGSSSSSRSRTR